MGVASCGTAYPWYNNRMSIISVQDIQRDLQAFLRRVEAGESFLIVRGEQPLAEVRPVPAPPLQPRPAEKGPAFSDSTRPDNLETKFPALVERWKKDTEADSSIARMVRHPAYQQIIEMGQAAVPLLLAELQRELDFWFAALHAITGANPRHPKPPARSSRWRRRGLSGAEKKSTSSDEEVAAPASLPLPKPDNEKTENDHPYDHRRNSRCNLIERNLVRIGTESR